MYDRRMPSQIRKPKFCAQCGTGYLPYNVNDRYSKCHHCGVVIYMSPVLAVSVLVVDDGKFLLQKRGKSSYEGGKWGLPCGRVELNEDFLTAAIRETKEETGIDIEIDSIISVVTNYFVDLQSLVVVLLARAVGGDLLDEPNWETEVVKWFTFGSSLPEMAFEADKHIIERYFTTRLDGAPIDPKYRRLKKV